MVSMLMVGTSLTFLKMSHSLITCLDLLLLLMLSLLGKSQLFYTLYNPTNTQVEVHYKLHCLSRMLKKLYTLIIAAYKQMHL